MSKRILIHKNRDDFNFESSCATIVRLYYLTFKFINNYLIAWNPPSTWMFSPVTPLERSTNTQPSYLLLRSTLRFNGALASISLRIVLNPPTPLALKVRIGPAEIALTRILSSPKSKAKYLTFASKLALATPITL